MKKITFVLNALFFLIFAADTRAYILLNENFEECTLGGSMTPGVYTTGTTGISPTVGTVIPFPGDYGVIVAGLNGSSKCLQAQDQVSGNDLRLLFNPSTYATSGMVALSFDFMASGTMSAQGPLNLFVADGTSPSGSRVLQVLLYSDLHFVVTNSASSLSSGAYSTGSLVAGKQYHVTLNLNLNTFLYTFSIFNLTDNVSVLSAPNLSFIHDANIAAAGLGNVDVYFGFPDFGASPAAFDFDNLLLTAGGTVFGAAYDEFVGPFASWINVKTACGAVGNGVADDTVAIQNALSALGTNPNATVLYFPAGTYKITSGLVLQSAERIGIIGQDPLTTTIKWGGASNSTVPMLWLNGVASSRFGRITWDGSGSTVTGIAQEHNTTLPKYNGEANFHMDERFQNMAIGVALGKLGTDYDSGDGDNTLIRDHFFRCSQAGVRTGSWNSFQNYLWDCEFVDNCAGADNAGGEGSFYAYRSYFENSSLADIYLPNPLRSFDFRGNTSVSSSYFLYETGGAQTIDGLQFQDNKILDATNVTNAGAAIYSTELGNIILTDNQIRSASGATGPAVVVNPYGYLVGPDACSVGNTYTVSTPVQVNGSGGRYYTQNDSIVSRGSIDSTVPALPGTPANLSRFVKEPATFDSTGIQNAINAVVSRQGQHPVVHLPAGNYNITQTITIPAGLDVQLVGDCMGSTLIWAGPANGTMFVLTGPSAALISDVYLACASNANGIYITNPDQVGAEVYIDGGSWLAWTLYGLYVDNASSHLVVECQDFLCASATPGDNPPPAVNARFVNVIGSGSVSNTGYTAIFGSDGTAYDTTSSGATFQVSNQAKLDVVDHYCEQYPARLIQLSGANTVTFAGEVGCPVSETVVEPWVEIDNISGPATFINCFADRGANSTTPYIFVNGETSATQALFLGFSGYEGTATGYGTGSSSYLSVSGSGGTVSLDNSTYGDNTGACWQVPNQGSALTSAFVTAMLSQSRAIKPAFPPATISGVTTVRLINVGMTNAITCLQVGP